jgi:hypothetical protein
MKSSLFPWITKFKKTALKGNNLIRVSISGLPDFKEMSFS